MKLHLPKRLTAALAALYAVAIPLVTTVGTGVLSVPSVAQGASADHPYNGPDNYKRGSAYSYYLLTYDVPEYTLDVTNRDSFWLVGDEDEGTVCTLGGIDVKAGASINIGWNTWSTSRGLTLAVNALTIGDGTEAAVLNVDPGSNGAVINAHIKNISGVLSGITNKGTLKLGDAEAADNAAAIVVSAPITNSGTLSFLSTTRFELDDLSAYDMVGCSYTGVAPGTDGLGKEIRTYNLIANTAGASVQGVDNITFSLEGVTATAGDGGNVTFSIAGEEDIYIIQSETGKTTSEAAQLGATKVSVGANSTINCNSTDIGLDSISGEGHVVISTDMSLTGSKASVAIGRLTVGDNATLTVGGGEGETNSLGSFTSVYLDGGTISYNNRNDTLHNVTVETGKNGTIHSEDMGAAADGNKLVLAGDTRISGALTIKNYWNAQFEINSLVGSGTLTLGHESAAAQQEATYNISLGAFTGTLNVNDDKTTVTLQGNVNGATIGKTKGTLKYTGTSVTNSTLTGVVLAGSERVTVSGTVNIADMASCNLTNSTNGYAFVGSGTLNFSGVSDLTRNSEGTATTHSKIGMEGGSNIHVLSDATLTVGGLVNTTSNLASNASLNVHDNATLVLDETSADNRIASITNNGTITVRGVLTTGAVTNNGSMSIQNTATFGSLTSGERGNLTVTEGGSLTLQGTATVGNLSGGGGLLVAVGASVTVNGTIGSTNLGEGASLQVISGKTFTTGNEMVTSLTDGTDAVISGTGLVSVATAGITYTNAAITVDTDTTLATAATLANSKLTVEGGGSVKTEVAADSVNSFDATAGSVNVSTGASGTAQVETLAVGSGNTASFTTGSDARATVEVSGTAALENGSTVGGNVTITGSGSLEICGTGFSADGFGAMVEGTLTANATAISLAEKVNVTDITTTTTFVLATAQVMDITGDFTAANFYIGTLADGMSAEVSVQPMGSGTYTIDPATASQLVLTLTAADPGTLTQTAVAENGVSVTGKKITLTVTDSLAGVTGGFNVTVGEEAWQTIVDGMVPSGGIYQNATIILTGADGTTLDLATSTGGAVTLNGYAGTGNRGEYFVAYIPEPATATLSLLALASLAARRRRK